MNLCVYYILSEAVMPRWRRTLAFQEVVFPAWKSLPKVFIVDRGFQYEVPGDIVYVDLFQNGIIWFSRAKNTGLQWAYDQGFQWVLDCDADTVILRPPQVEPSTGYSAMKCHFSGEKDTDETLLKLWRDGCLEFRASSRFLLRRDIFEKYRYDEGFVDWGYEDLDFNENVLGKAGIYQRPCDSAGIHIWHSRVRNTRGNGKERYMARCAEIKSQRG